MENFHGEQMELPPGFRFHPTDEELIIHYLRPKVYDINFSATAVTKIDLNKVEPWDLPKMAKMGEDEWYFFSSKDKKYPTGSRTNRATEFGYWKATGKDKEICKSKKLIGMKKTLVFYKGRAPRGQRTNWVMHEYRLDKKDSTDDFSATKTEWVISRIFHKDSTGKKTHISGLATTNNESQHSNKLPLVDRARISEFDTSHVTCFSGPSQYNKPYEKSFESLNPTVMNPSHLAQLPIQSPLFCPQTSFQDSNSFSFNYFSDNNGAEMKQPPKAEYSQEDIGGTSTDLSSVVFNHETAQRYWEDQEYPISFGGPLDTDCLWNY